MVYCTNNYTIQLCNLSVDVVACTITIQLCNMDAFFFSWHTFEESELAKNLIFPITGPYFAIVPQNLVSVSLIWGIIH